MEVLALKYLTDSSQLTSESSLLSLQAVTPLPLVVPPIFLEDVIAEANELFARCMSERKDRKHERIQLYFEECIPRYTDPTFRQHFRLTRATMEVVIRLVSEGLAPQLTGRPKIPTDKQVLFSVWVLANQEAFRSVSDRFGLDRGLGHRIFVRFISVLHELRSTVIKWPSNVQSTLQGFNALRSKGFPGVVACVDGCHIAIRQPTTDKRSYYNRNKFHSIVLQGTCDHRKIFTDIYVGWPGSVHDARIWQNSPLFAKLASGLLSEDYHILGDSAYPISKFLLAPYKDTGNLLSKHYRFNQLLSSTRCVIEQAFAVLKGRFRRLKYLDMTRLDLASQVITSSCVLHNLCIFSGDQWIQDECEEILPEPEQENDLLDSLEGKEKRDNLMNMLFRN